MNVEGSCLIANQGLTVLDLCISSFRGCFLRRLDNCRLSAIHPCAPLAMKGAAPASSKQQMIRSNGGLLGGRLLGMWAKDSSQCWTHLVLEHWETKMRKNTIVRNWHITFSTMFLHLAWMSLTCPDFSWFLLWSWMRLHDLVCVCVTGVWQSTGNTGIWCQQPDRLRRLMIRCWSALGKLGRLVDVRHPKCSRGSGGSVDVLRCVLLELLFA